MRRRDFITLLGSAAAGWPLVARAQQVMPVVGFLHSGSPASYSHLVVAFHQSMKEAGFTVGQNVAIEYRWAEGHYDRLPQLVDDLVRRQVAVIASTGGPSPILAAKAATTTIPIVFSTGMDPIKTGLVASLNRPGGNITGVNIFTAVMEGKRLGLLRELVPNAALIAVMVNGSNPNSENQTKEVEAEARAVGQRIHFLKASTEGDLDKAFATAAQMQAAALLVAADPYFTNQRDQIVALAARHAIPAIYEQREFAVAGGLMSYGTSLSDAYRQVGIYTGRVLNGEKPADLPVIQSTRFEFVINQKTAQALRLDVRGALSARADEVIE